MKRFTLILFLLLSICYAFAGYEKINGVIYYLDTYEGKAKVVTFYGNGSSVTIPAYVNNYGRKYKVTEIGLTQFDAGELKQIFRMKPNELTQYRERIITLNLPNTLEIISERAFWLLNSLKTLTIPASVKTIWGNAFTNTWNLVGGPASLTSITVLSEDFHLQASGGVMPSLESIKQACPKLKTITYPVLEKKRLAEQKAQEEEQKKIAAEQDRINSTVEEWGCKEGLYGLKGHWYMGGDTLIIRPLKAEDITDGETTTAPCSFSNMVIEEGVTNMMNFFETGDGMVGSNAPIDLKMPSTMKVIEDYAFDGFSTLNSITLNNGLQKIGKLAFSGTDISKIVIPNSILRLEESTFDGCAKLKDVTLSNRMEYIDKECFANCTSLECVEIPNSVKSIAENAFNGCTNLKKAYVSPSTTFKGNSFPSTTKVYLGHCGPMADWVEYKNGLLVIDGSGLMESSGWLVFRNNIQKVNLSSDIHNICDDAFIGCENLASIDLSHVTQIGAQAFLYCSNLADVVFCNDLKQIGASAFGLCKKITVIAIPGSVTDISTTAFTECENLSSLTINEGVQTIGMYAFNQCSNLPKVKIPNSVQTIQQNAFYSNSKLSEVTLGSGIKEIGAEAFGDCPNLTSVYCYAPNPPKVESNSIPSTCIIYIPKGNIKAYKDWKSMWKIKPIK